jgi:hypothetical protein
MKTHPITAACCLLSFLLASCSGGGVSLTMTGEPRKAISWREVTVVGVEPKGFEPIADIRATDRFSLSFSDPDRMDAAVKRLKQAAARLGANTVLLGDSFGRQPSTVSRVTRKALGFIPQRNAVGAAVVDALSPDITSYSIPAKAGYVPVAE